ncbi:hypothetical protein [Lysinibacillus sp. TE18511]
MLNYSEWEVESKSFGSLFTTSDATFEDGSFVLDENALHPDKSIINVHIQANLKILITSPIQNSQ